MSMELRDANSHSFVNLEPVSYQFLSPVGNDFDDNWLDIRGHAHSGGEEWTFVQPALLVDEAWEIAKWIRSAAAGKAVPLVADSDGSTSPATQTIEPNVGMGLVSFEPNSVTIRVFLWLESAPPSTWRGQAKTNMEFFIDLTLSPAALTQAADAWEAELGSFPRRPQPPKTRASSTTNV